MPEPLQKYRVPARVIHWIMAILILCIIPIGFLMVRAELERSTQNFLFITHKNVGTLLLVLFFVRAIYRWRRPPQLKPVELPKIQEFAAHATHIGLYALLLIMPLAGYVRVRAGGFPIEALDAMGIPSFVPRSEALAEFAKAVHYYGAYAFTALILMHIGAAAFHGLIRRDGIFTRMWPPVGKNS
ncbi:cytochrome b [Yoonia sp. BS5-3]|uniref:Cytochrome b n=1 Tax=Yoonia phaeophyticola TaxID=3137369 RepID=A0ABZ2VAY4_9RHOB